MNDEYRFMEDLSPEEFRKLYEGDFSDKDSYRHMRRESKQPGDSYTHRHQKLWEDQPRRQQWTRPPETKGPVCNFDGIMWQAAYRITDVKCTPDFNRNLITFSVPNFHTQTYRMDTVIHGYVGYVVKQTGISWQKAARVVSTANDMGALFRYMIDRGLFPYPYEVAINIRRHYIDLKQVLTHG